MRKATNSVVKNTYWNPKKNPGGLAGDLSFPDLKIETGGTQIGDDAASSYAL